MAIISMQIFNRKVPLWISLARLIDNVPKCYIVSIDVDEFRRSTIAEYLHADIYHIITVYVNTSIS